MLHRYAAAAAAAEQWLIKWTPSNRQFINHLSDVLCTVRQPLWPQVVCECSLHLGCESNLLGGGRSPSVWETHSCFVYMPEQHKLKYEHMSFYCYSSARTVQRNKSTFVCLDVSLPAGSKGTEPYWMSRALKLHDTDDALKSQTIYLTTIVALRSAEGLVTEAVCITLSHKARQLIAAVGNIFFFQPGVYEGWPREDKLWWFDKSKHQ